MSIRIASEAQALELFRKHFGSGSRKKKIYSFYSSELNRIITDEHLMMIPVDQRMATRAHGVFDVIYVKKLNIINLDAHVKRLFKSSDSVSIKPPLSQQQTSHIISQVIKQTLRNQMRKGFSLAALRQEVFGVRLCISSGYGDFGIASIDKKPIFYMSIFQPYINYDVQKQGVNQFVVKIVKNHKQLVHSKTVNYVQNSLMANQSKIRGGYQGIKALQNGVLLQAAVANIAFIFGKQFATPRFQTVIEGTTIKKLLKYVEKLKQEGLIDKISFRDITVEQAEKNASEMMVIGGDKIVPVLNFNGKSISKKKGKYAQMFQQWYQKQNQTISPIIIEQQL